MNKKLLYRTSRAYLVFSCLILLVSARLFYFVTQRLYLEEADETLLLHKKEFLEYSAPALNDSTIEIWNKFNRNVKIRQGGHVSRDSIFSTAYFDTLESELEPYRELSSPVEIQGKPYTLMVKLNLVESEDLLTSLAFLFFIMIAALLAGLFLINRKFSLTLWKPFYETLGQMERFEIDKDKLLLFNESGIEEFNRLNASIKKLIEKNKLIFRSQREFIENAAHELQTPLAVFQAKVDMLIQRPDVTKEQSEILGSLNDNIARLNRLNKNLLLLSKIENAGYSDKQMISLNDCVQKNLEFFIEQAKSKKLVIQTELNDAQKVSSNPVLAEILISNLFLNAIRHNIQGGEIKISSANNMLLFSNTGQLQSLDPGKLFSRFYKMNPSEQGAGLGLAIVKKIADGNNWKVSYTHSGNIHSFQVLF